MKILDYFIHPTKILVKLDNLNIIRLPDELYLKILYKLRMGKKLNLKEPVTFNEKLQWLKLYNKDPLYTKMVDKYEAKKYVASLIGNDYIIPTYGVFNKWEEIDFDKLPNEFVIKCTHDSGGFIICKDKDKLNFKEAQKTINSNLKKNYFYLGREWPYKNVVPRIIIEKYMKNNNEDSLKDYKFFCFNGKVEFMYISNDINEHYNISTYTDYFDRNFKKLDMRFKSPNSPEGTIIKKPINFDKMIEFSELLSKNIPHVRIDWYEINNKLYFGEITFFHSSGFFEVYPKDLMYKYGNMININKIKKK